MVVPHPDEARREIAARAPLPVDMLGLIDGLWPALGSDPAAWPRVSLDKINAACGAD